MIHALHELVEAEHKVAHIFRVIVHSSVYLALGGVGLSVFSTVALNLQHHLGAYAISFLMIFAMYNMNRYSDIQEDVMTHPKRHSFVVKYRKYIEFSAILAMIISLVVGYVKNVSIIAMILLPMALAVLYSFKWIPDKVFMYSRFKDIPLMKNVVVAFCWAVITTGVVVTYSDSAFTFAVFSVALIVFTRFFINTVVFDMRDVRGDRKHGTHTLPVLLGLRNTQIFLYSLLTALVLFTFIVTWSGVLPPIIHLVNLTALQAYYYIYLSNKSVPMHTLCDVVADGEFMVMGVVALLGEVIIGK